MRQQKREYKRNIIQSVDVSNISNMISKLIFRLANCKTDEFDEKTLKQLKELRKEIDRRLER